MSDVRGLHKKAMELVQLAIVAKNEDNSELYFKLSKEALDIEVQAANGLFARLDAEPTRSVLFRSAATIAYNCGELEICEKMVHSGLAGNPPVEILEELKSIQNSLEYRLDAITKPAEENRYMNYLRDKAINIKVKPAVDYKKYSQAIFINDILGVMRSLKSSFDNFIQVRFLQEFGREKYKERTDNVIGQLMKDMSLLYVDGRYKSFGASLSTDAVVMGSSEVDREIAEWKKNLFNEFKNDVVYIDLSSEEQIRMLEGKYSDEERRAIFSSVINLYGGKKVDISYTDASFEKIIYSPRPINKTFRDRLVTKQQIEDSEKQLFRLFGMASEPGKIKKSDVIMTEKMNFAQFDLDFQNIQIGSDSLTLKKNLEVLAVYENGHFSIDFEPFGITVINSDFYELQTEFMKACFDKYKFIMDMQEDEMDVDNLAIKENLNEYVFAST